MQRQVDFLSSGCRCRLASGGFDWRDVSQVVVPFACGLFSSAGKFYRSSSVFRGSGPGFSSAHFWSLLHWRRLSVVLPAATVDCCLSSLRAGVCSLLWQWWISARVLMVACLPLLWVSGSAPSPVPWMLIASTGSGQSWPILDLTLGEFPEGLCRFFSCLALSVPSGVRSAFAPDGSPHFWFCLVVRI